jgi:outer membrane protein TolC
MGCLLYGVLVFAQALGFSEALEQAVHTPTVEGTRRVHEQRAAGGAGLSRLTHNPSVQVQSGGRDLAIGGSGPELYVGVSQRFSLSRAGKQRKQALARELAADAAEGRLALREARRTIAHAWLLRWSAQEAQAGAEREVALARELSARMEPALAAGEATRAELAEVHAWLAEAQLAALAAEGEAFERGVELGRALGAVQPQPVVVAPELPSIELPNESALRAALAALEGAPRVAAARAAREAEAARLLELRASAASELTLGALGFREGGGDVAAVATLELSLPVFERRQRERATTAALLAAAQRHEQNERVAARADHVLLMHDVVHTEEVLELTRNRLLKAAEELAEAQAKRLEAHEGTIHEWVLARRAVLRARLESVRAERDRVFARFDAHEQLASLRQEGAR